MRIGLTFDLQTDPDDPRQAEFDPPSTVEALSRSLEARGHEVVRLGGAAELLEARERLQGVDLVFNLAEGREGRCREAEVPVILELLKMPYVGSDPLALSLGLDKAVCKTLVAAEGILTPRWVVAPSPDAVPDPLPLRLPVIIKPRWEGSGRGIDAGAVAMTASQAAGRVRQAYRACPEPVLIEELIPAGELTVLLIGNDPSTRATASGRGPLLGVVPSEAKPSRGTTKWVPGDPPAFLPGARRSLARTQSPTSLRDFWGPRALPVGTHAPHAYPAVQRPIDPVTRLSCHVLRPSPDVWECPLELDGRLDGEARRVAQRVFQLIGCRDMARVDLRVDAEGRVHFLEINPLPSFDPRGTFGLLAEHAGVSYADMVGRVLEAAARRLGLAGSGRDPDGSAGAAHARALSVASP